MREGRRLYLTDSDFAPVATIPLDRDDGLYEFVSTLYWSPNGRRIFLLLSVSDPYCSSDCQEALEYHLLDPVTLHMSAIQLEQLGIGKVYPCGFTPDGRNLVLASNDYLYFLDVDQERLSQQIQVGGFCPSWLPSGSFNQIN
jgi:hypothetical protein